MKRTIAWLLALCMVLCLVPAVSAVQSGTCGDSITWTFSDGVLTLSGSGAMPEEYLNSRPPWYTLDVKKVVVQEGITTIAWCAFENCFGLTAVELAESVQTIGSWAFSRCIALEQVDFGDGLEQIEGSAFNGCTALNRVELPASLENLDIGAFRDCTALEEIHIVPGGSNYKSVNGVVYTADGAELYLVPLGYRGVLTIEPGTLRVGWNAAQFCDGLTGIEFPDSLTTIGACAFSDCSGLTQIHIPASVTELLPASPANCFGACENLSMLTVDSGNPAYYAEDNVIYSKDGKTLVIVPAAREGAFIVPEGIENVESGCFDGCAKLTDIVLPGTLKEMDDAFAGCSGITSFAIPDGIDSIGCGALMDCKSLIAIYIPESVKTVGSSAFYGCTALEEIFYSGSDWDSVHISATGNDPLEGVAVRENENRSVVIHSSQGDGIASFLWDDNALEILGSGEMKSGGLWEPYWDRITQLWIRGDVYDIPANMFSGMAKLKAVKLDPEVRTIGEEAFQNCPALKRVLLPYSLTAIGENAFQGCGKLDSVHYHESEAFWNELTIGSGNEALLNATRFYNSYNPFEDVSLTGYYYDPVLWAVGEDITKGVDDTHFAPDRVCTRGQVVTFLWRAAGSPEPEAGHCPFVDVKQGTYCYKAVLWAVENGITSGMDASHFQPNGACTRGQVVTFLWRAAGKPAAPAGTEVRFTDLRPGAFYLSAVAWAVGSGVTSGVSATSFSPEADCTRGQIVTFLYRAA